MLFNPASRWSWRRVPVQKVGTFGKRIGHWYGAYKKFRATVAKIYLGNWNWLIYIDGTFRTVKKGSEKTRPEAVAAVERALIEPPRMLFNSRPRWHKGHGSFTYYRDAQQEGAVGWVGEVWDRWLDAGPSFRPPVSERFLYRASKFDSSRWVEVGFASTLNAAKAKVVEAIRKLEKGKPQPRMLFNTVRR
jgi:hypothetical protein